MLLEHHLVTIWSILCLLQDPFVGPVVKLKSITSQDLQAHARDLLGLLPAFCNLPTDICHKFRPLAGILVTFIQDSLMHENTAVALQVIVNQNKSVLDQKDGAGDTSSYAVNKSLLEFCNIPTYSKKTAIRNIKALTSCSSELLIALTDIFLDSPPEKRSYLKAKDEAVREAAYDVLLKISVSLRDPSCVSSDGAYEKLINMIMGYLTSASPHIKSGAVPVLSVLVYKDTDICLSMPDLLPSILSLLQGKALEVIKAVLGFVKVLVFCLRD